MTASSPTSSEWMDETGAEITEIAMIGWINADLAYQGLVAAGPQFDRASVIAATNEMTEYTAGGLIGADRLDPAARAAHRGGPGDATGPHRSATRWSGSSTGSSSWSATRRTRSCAGTAPTATGPSPTTIELRVSGLERRG